MKVYVSVDMEGIAGIVLRSQIIQGEPHYQEARRLLTDEVNAVVEGLLSAGARDIIVKDAHSRGFNFLVHDLHPGATYSLGGTPIDRRFPGLDASFDGAILLGYHGMAGTQHAILDHTYSIQSYTRVELNGKAIGEIDIDSLLFGLHGVPVLLVTGDDRACDEAERVLGGVATYRTKTGTGRQSGLIKPPRRVNAELKAALQAALANKGRCSPHRLEGPYELILHFVSTDLADGRRCDGTSVERLDGLRVAYRETDLVRLFRKAF